MDGKTLAETKTDSTGAYLFSNLQPGSYTVNATIQGGMASGKVQLGTGNSSRLILMDSSPNLIPQSAPLALRGKIIDASGALIPGVTVTATNSVTRKATTTVTGVEKTLGTYYFTGLEPGMYTVSASLTGFGTFASSLQLASEITTQNITLVLAADGRMVPKTCSVPVCL